MQQHATVYKGLLIPRGGLPLRLTQPQRERGGLYDLLDDRHEMVAQLRQVALASQRCAIFYPSIIPRTRALNPLLMYDFTLALPKNNEVESPSPVQIGQRQSVSYRRAYCLSE